MSVESTEWFIIYKNGMINPSIATYDLSCKKLINNNLTINLQVLKFKNSIPLDDINKVYLNAHIENIKGQIREYIKYIKDNKDGRHNNIDEKGKIKLAQKKINNTIDINKIIKLYINKISNNQLSSGNMSNNKSKIEDNKPKVEAVKSNNEETKSNDKDNKFKIEVNLKVEDNKPKDKKTKYIRTVGDLMKINDPRVLNKTEYIIWKEIHYEMNNDIDIDSNKNNIYQNDDNIIDLFNDPRDFKYKIYHNWKDMILYDDEDENKYLSKDVKIYYIFGPVNANKLEKANEIIRLYKEKYGTIVNYINYDDGYWNGRAFHNGFYSGVGFRSKIAIYKDFYEYDMYVNRFKELIDNSRRPMKVKHGWKRNDYELIIITSVQNPKDIYKEYPEEDRRRILESITEIIDLTPKDN